MIEQIFEDAYNHYDGKLKLSKLHEYLSKIQVSNTKKYLKCLDQKKDGMAVYNVVDILVSKSVADGTAAETDGEKSVRIVISAKPNSKTYTFKRFADNCKKVLNALKDVDGDSVSLQLQIDDNPKGLKFRFYYDDEKDFAILVRGTDAKGAIKFLETFEEDLLTYIKAPEIKVKEIKNTDKPKADKKADKKAEEPA